MKKYKNLKDMEIFHGVRPETMDEMQSLGRVVTMKKGTVCYRASDKQDNIFILMDGQAIIYTLTRCGNRKIIFVHGGGELLNESIITVDRTTVFCDLIRDSKVFVIRNQQFCRLMEQDFTLVRAVMRIQERKLWRTSHQLKNTPGSIFLERKLAAKLWKLARDFGVPVDNTKVRIDVSLSITFLADFLGAPRETTSRICRNLAEKGLIEMDKKTIIVDNMDCLARFYKNHCKEECFCGKGQDTFTEHKR